MIGWEDEWMYGRVEGRLGIKREDRGQGEECRKRVGGRQDRNKIRWVKRAGSKKRIYREENIK